MIPSTAMRPQSMRGERTDAAEHATWPTTNWVRVLRNLDGIGIARIEGITDKVDIVIATRFESAIADTNNSEVDEASMEEIIGRGSGGTSKSRGL